MSDIKDTLAALSEAATPGEWSADTIRSEGAYGSGDDTHEGFATTAIYSDDGKILFDALNSDAILVQEEWDGHAYDLTSAANAAFIVALVNAYCSGQLVPVPSVETVAAEIACHSPTGMQYPWHTEAAEAIIAAIVGGATDDR